MDILNVLVLIVSTLISLNIYLIPTYVARIREHHNKVPIMILNIFLGWTFVGWVVALIWATTTVIKSDEDKKIR